MMLPHACLLSAASAHPSISTGKERDSESGNDYFGARYYASSMGRYMSPDWSKNPQGVPYADFTNPQSLNLYSYVKNNPLSSFDDDGHVTIQIRYSEIGPGYAHSFIVVTDTDGTRTVFRAGPSNNVSPLWITPATGGSASQSSSPQSSRSDSSNSSSPGAGGTANGDPWGQLQAVHGDFVPGGPDYDKNQESPAGVSTLLSNDEPAGDYITKLLQYEGAVNNANIPYDPLSTSSNAYATGAAGFLGLKVPPGPIPAPGGSTTLPVTPPPPTPRPPPTPPCSVAGAC
jgi:RHS repeat-associated protein